MSDPEEDPDVVEYVLGTLSTVERESFNSRRRSDPALDAAVRDWEERLAPLCEAVREVQPPDHVYTSLTTRLFGATGGANVTNLSDVRDLKRSVRRWRAATAACAALAAALLAWVSLAPAPKQDQRFVAVLQKDAGSPAVLLEVDVGTRRLTIRPVSGQEPADKSLELWLIDASLGAPRSLGTLAPNGTTRASLASYDPATIQGATYAVTLEPLGGSPTGKPSGPPILVGRLAPNP